jgi:hypothetical protein
MTESELNDLIRPTVDYLQGIRFPSSNFPSSLGNNTDKLVQWCHGAPGVVFLFAEAYKESSISFYCFMITPQKRTCDYVHVEYILLFTFMNAAKCLYF